MAIASRGLAESGTQECLSPVPAPEGAVGPSSLYHLVRECYGDY